MHDPENYLNGLNPLECKQFLSFQIQSIKLTSEIDPDPQKGFDSWEVVYTFLNLQVRLPNPFAAGFFEYGLCCDTVLILDYLLI